MKSQAKKFIKSLPYFKQFFQELHQLRQQVHQQEHKLKTQEKEIERCYLQLNQQEHKLKTQEKEIERCYLQLNQLDLKKSQLQMWVPAGHYYSPIPSINEIKLKEKQIWNNSEKQVLGVDLNEQEQVSLLNELQQYYQELPFDSSKKENLRYFFENPAYSYSDAIFLYSMIRYVKPKRIIEVGSGYSSCVTLDTNELFFNNTISITLIEPYPELVRSLMKEEDKSRVEIIQKNLQDVSLNIFLELMPGDFLFIDSTHVAKINSDVNYIFARILPSLNSGVYIHFHDIFYPFEYPKEWIYEGRA
ncbi:class I SAM-dependent methyltransferase [Scytonema sp. UIC 10036]|uniref:class I SAM-dependent methyltransferase n=1 Tax=Scytonema sp. UIC 10036 TaxID=2304196 RepID=UPI0012DA0DE3|nr:class I SAM-dependent methyltransferase [Scytonema sp. UIC 10036]MUG98649.1 class I SAM-dependent methyltransferase [Scytonema sp. UIC 10036]